MRLSVSQARGRTLTVFTALDACARDRLGADGALDYTQMESSRAQVCCFNEGGRVYDGQC